MNEQLWYSNHIKPRWNRPEKRWVSWKVQDAYNGGLPDTDNCFEGVAAKIELKYEDAWPKREDTALWFSYLDKTHQTKAIVSASQASYLKRWHEAGGLAMVLCGIDREWVLLEWGKFKNRPMSKDQLIEVAELTYIGGSKGTYEVLEQIPPFIVREYAGQRGAGAGT